MERIQSKLKLSSPTNFVSASICPRDSNVNDEKVTLCVNFYEFNSIDKEKKVLKEISRELLKPVRGTPFIMSKNSLKN